MQETTLQICLFETALGWSLLAGADQQVHFLTFACASEKLARKRWVEASLTENLTGVTESDWYPAARLALQEYAEGKEVDLSFIDCDLRSFTPFQQQVLRTVGKIPRGQVLTYGEVARLVQRPGAARAVGGTMARNKVPLIIPCHRVVGANGKMTGFSAPRGVALKQQLLEMEQRSAAGV